MVLGKEKIRHMERGEKEGKPGKEMLTVGIVAPETDPDNRRLEGPGQEIA